MHVGVSEWMLNGISDEKRVISVFHNTHLEMRDTKIFYKYFDGGAFLSIYLLQSGSTLKKEI